MQWQVLDGSLFIVKDTSSCVTFGCIVRILSLVPYSIYSHLLIIYLFLGRRGIFLMENIIMFYCSIRLLFISLTVIFMSLISCFSPGCFGTLLNILLMFKTVEAKSEDTLS